MRRRCSLEQRNRLVEAHRELVRPIALHYFRCSRESLDDLLQVGLLGLIRAAELFNSDQGTPFTAFARPHIRGAILHHLRDIAPTVRLPRRQAELQERLAKLERQLMAQGCSAKPADLQDQLGIDAGQWELLMRQRQLNRPSSFSELPVELLEVANDDVNDRVNDDNNPASQRQAPGLVSVASLLESLDPRQRLVVQQVVLEGLSYRQIARRLAVSPMTVQRLLHRGLEQLRGNLEPDSLRTPGSVDPVPSAVRAC
jgi:RNA polymerase sigma-B factor